MNTDKLEAAAEELLNNIDFKAMRENFRKKLEEDVAESQKVVEAFENSGLKTARSLIPSESISRAFKLPVALIDEIEDEDLLGYVSAYSQQTSKANVENARNLKDLEVYEETGELSENLQGLLDEYETMCSMYGGEDNLINTIRGSLDLLTNAFEVES